MLYNKPKDITYTQMAIFIDEHVYSEEKSDELDATIYEYLYHLALMLARQGKLFSKSCYYEDFAIYMAGVMFMRLRNAKQFILTPDGTPKMKTIKSVLNYMKKILYPAKVNFEQQNYNQSVVEPDPDEISEADIMLTDKMCEAVDQLNNIEFNSCLQDIPNTVRSYLSKIPYRSDPALWNNIYVSCLLTFLSTITLSNVSKKRLASLKNETAITVDLLNTLYDKERYDDPILFHLDPSMKDYIRVLTNTIKHLIAKDLSLDMHAYVPSRSSVKDMMLQDLLSGEKEAY